MKSPRSLAAIVLSLAASLPAASVPAAAAVELSVGAHVDLGNDADLFLDISSRHFDLDPRRVHDASRLFPRPDDLAVALFIAGRSGTSVDAVFRYRSGGTPWYDVGRRCGVPIDAWFVPVDHDPGPPYGKAYGHWRKHRKNPNTRFTLSDVEARDLVAVRMAHEFYRVPVSTAMSWRSDGRDVRTLMNREYRRRHAEGRASNPGGGAERGGGKDKDKDKDKDRDDGRGAKHGRRSLD